MSKQEHPAPDFDSLWGLSNKELGRLGLGDWDGRLRLFRAEWYDEIPRGMRVLDIFGNVRIFEPGKSDKDSRFGFLAYGVLGAEFDQGAYTTDNRKEEQHEQR
jgi:hypothetical protein